MADDRGLRRRPVGLRVRLTAALIATSALTLAAVAIALLSPLQDRLRHDRLDALATAIRAGKPSLEGLRPTQLRAVSPALRSLVQTLHRRTSADVALLDTNGRVYASTDTDPGAFADVAAAARGRSEYRQIVNKGGDTEAVVALHVNADNRTFVLAAETPLTQVDDAVSGVVTAFAIAAVIGAVIALVLGIGLAARLSRRLENLRAAALTVAELGPEVEMTSDSRSDEVGDLSRAFATMQSRLNEQEQARRRFVATASHELRTPLTSLNLGLELLEDDVIAGRVDREETLEHIGSARRQADRVTTLAAVLLDLSRIDAGVPLAKDPVDLVQLSETVIGEFEAIAAGRKVSIQLDAPDACWATADPGSVARIIRILLDNALRFSPPSSAVQVRVSCDGDRPTLSVSDAGPGVAPEDRELIFDRFSRGSEPTGDKGFGLGLAIGRELARQMGGELQLEGTEPGATFTVVLPPGPQPAAE
jgi:signal transduction histidine kinase